MVTGKKISLLEDTLEISTENISMVEMYKEVRRIRREFMYFKTYYKRKEETIKEDFKAEKHWSSQTRSDLYLLKREFDYIKIEFNKMKETIQLLDKDINVIKESIKNKKRKKVKLKTKKNNKK